MIAADVLFSKVARLIRYLKTTFHIKAFDAKVVDAYSLTFDTVKHKILLDFDSIKWFESFLQGRRQ